MADFCPVFLGLPQMAKGNSQMERENSEDRQHKKRLSFLYIDRFVTKKIERLLRSLAMGYGEVLEEIDIDWDNRWLLGDDSAAHFYYQFLIESRRLFVGF